MTCSDHDKSHRRVMTVFLLCKHTVVFGYKDTCSGLIYAQLQDKSLTCSEGQIGPLDVMWLRHLCHSLN